MDQKEARRITNLGDELYDLDEEVKNLSALIGHYSPYVCRDGFNGFYSEVKREAHLEEEDLYLLINRRIARANRIRKELAE